MFRTGRSPRSIPLSIILVACVGYVVACAENPTGAPEATPEFAKGGDQGPPPGKGKNGGGAELAVIDFEVTTFVNTAALGLTDDAVVNGEIYAANPDVPAGFLGCPVANDAQRPCNEATLTFQGSPDSAKLQVGHDVRGLFYSAVENAHLALTLQNTAMPYVPVDARTSVQVDANTGSIVLRWQGQRRTPVDAPAGYDWDRIPDLDPLGSDDSFAFRALLKRNSDGAWLSRSTVDFPAGGASYRGDAIAPTAVPVIDRIQLTRNKKGKSARGNVSLSFEVQSFTDPSDTTTNFAADHTVLVTRPDGSRYIANATRTGVNPDDPEKPSIYKQGFVTDDVTQQTGCHLVEVIGVYGWSTGPKDGRQIVWDPTGSGAIQPIAIQVGQTVTWSRGPCP